MQKIRLSEKVIRSYYTYGRYDHGIPKDGMQVYTTVGCYYRTPYVKIVLPCRMNEIHVHDFSDEVIFYMSYCIKLKCPKKMMFKSFTLDEFFKRFYGVKINNRLVIKFYK